MANVVVVLDKRESAAARLAGKKRALNGARRKAVKEVRAKLYKVLNNDHRVRLRAASLGVEPYMVFGDGASSIRQAVMTVLTYCDEALNEYR